MKKIGMDIRCTMPHGDVLCLKNGVTNHDLWIEYNSLHDTSRIENQRMSLKEYFEYDTSFLMCDGGMKHKDRFYISDSGGTWYTRDNNIPFEPTIEFEGGVNAIGRVKLNRVIGEFNKKDNAIMLLLLHPRWWKVA